jgi:hypothetical protein
MPSDDATPTHGPTETPRGPVEVVASWLKPRWEIVGVVSALIVALSGGVSWIVAHFATEDELKMVECTADISLKTQALPLFSAVSEMKIDGKRGELRELRKANLPDQDKIQALEDEIRDLHDAKQSADAKYQQALADAPIKCRVQR